MKRLRWPLLIVLLALAAIAILLYSQQTVLPPVIPEEIKPVTGGVYTEGLVGAFSRFNPVLDFYNSSDHDVDRLLFSGLLNFDDRGVPYGDLAESWGISLDGTVYNFSLRENAVWHDGTPVTSDDIIYTVSVLQQEESILSPDVKELWSKVEVVRLHENMIQFRLPEPFAPFLDYLTFGILPSHLVGGLSAAELVNDSFNLQPVGSGPYRFDRLIVEDGQVTGVVLSAFEDFYGQRPFIDQMVFRYYPDSVSALEAYQRGEVMGISRVTVESLPAALKEGNLNLYTGRLPELSMVFLNLDNPEVPFLEDTVVRKAMMLSLNRQWMIDHLLDGQAIVANGPIFPNTWAYYEGGERYGYDQAAALSMLKEAGYTIPAEGGNVRVSEDGTPLRLDLLYPDDPRHAAIAEAIARDWLRIGIEANLMAVPYDQLVVDYLNTRLYEAALVDINLAHSPDPDPYPFWHEAQASSGQNYSKWGDRQVSEYLEQARVVTDITNRTKFYRNFQIRFSQELPSLPLFYPVYTYAVDAEVQGVRMGPLFDTSDRFSRVTSWFLLARRATAQDVQSTDVPVSSP